jgi:hypothetical protein
VEIDVSASYLTVLHGLKHYPFDSSGDPYAVGIDRNVVKLWTLATFGNKGHIKSWPPKIAKDYLSANGRKIGSVATVNAVREKMIAKHPVLALWVDKGLTWADLMFAESNAIIGAMTELMNQGKPSLTVHDSLIVRAEDEEAARAALSRNYQAFCGITPRLSQKQEASV